MAACRRDGIGRSPYSLPEQARDLPVRAPARDEAEHLHLAVTQACRPSETSARWWVSAHLQDRVDRFGVQATSRRFGAQLLGGGVRRERRTVGPFLGHGLVCVGGREHAGAVRDHRRRRLAIVAGAVQALVMHAGQGG